MLQQVCAIFWRVAKSAETQRIKTAKEPRLLQSIGSLIKEAMKTYLLLFALLVLVPSLLLGLPVNDRYRKFVQQHLKVGMGITQCNNVMNSSVNVNECKPVNTFISTSETEIKKVCNRAGSPYAKKADMRVSNQPFTLVVCRQRGNNRYPNCQYTGRSVTHYVIIKCEQSIPVHYDGDVAIVNPLG